MNRGRGFGAAALLLVLAACAGAPNARVTGPAGAAATGEASLVRVTGLHASRGVNATITSTDARGVRWRAVVRLRADPAGQLTFDAGELMATMKPLGADPAGAYFWSHGSQSFRITVGDAGVTVERTLSKYVVRTTTVTADGLVGTFFNPVVNGRHSAVLVIGGSEGGLPGPLYPYALAGQGHPVLALAYFKAPGLPDTLSRIPLEYFATALRWMARQPGVDPTHLVVDGASRGGEAALLIGATFPNLVHGVIAAVPADVALCSYPGCTGAAWTLHGRPVPYTRQFDDPHPTDDPRAVIPVQRIAGPVLMNCGGQDTTWNSCAYAQAVMTELAPTKLPHHLQVCTECDHAVGRGIPDEPYAGTSRSYTADIRSYPAFFAAALKLLTA